MYDGTTYIKLYTIQEEGLSTEMRFALSVNEFLCKKNDPETVKMVLSTVVDDGEEIKLGDFRELM